MLLSVPGKVFAHVILAHIKPALLACRRPEQSGLTPNRSTADRILTLTSLAQRRQEFGRPTYLAYVDLRALAARLCGFFWPGVVSRRS